ncbi:hypothetical protein V5O48_001550 [Marasmius crinis-equi]|uniref:Uncharacterized protein n=1 Tax=Marasmius crinis-equi TaxID=585013 RepID=A0ABR3FY51_9AGAR
MNNGTPSPNPWQDSEPPLTPQPVRAPPIVDAAASDLSSGVKESEEESYKPAVKSEQQILDEFDPLASQEESDARKAWGDSEGHPPPPPVPSKDVNEKGVNEKEKEKGESSSASQQGTANPALSSTTPATASNTGAQNESPSSGTFPSLAALARSFSIPSLPRPTRPVSLDMAKPVPSPDTLSSFARQQENASKAGVVTERQKQKERQKDDQGEGMEESARKLEGEVERGESGVQKAEGDDAAAGEPPFDFPKFLDQLKTRSAEPVAKYLKSFLSNFAKRTFTTNDQIKIINDFLGFIARQMRDCEVWRTASDAEFDNAMEGMEKLVMNQLYQFTFTPAIAQSVPRRQVTTDDLERDRVLQQRIALFGWLEEKHLDIPEEEGSKGFMMFAEQELLKINHYKAPRDKLICILNCCKVIFGLIRHLRKEEGADSFVPILIFVVLRANPEHLLSNVEFINRFRNPEKLQSEAGYYLSSLVRNVEEAIQNLPPSEASSPYLPSAVNPPPRGSSLTSPMPSSSSSSHAGEESAQPLSLPAPPPPPGQQSPAQMLGEDAKRLLQKTGDTISKPLNAISRIFNEALDSLDATPSNTQTPTQNNRLASYLPGPFAPLELGREKGGAGLPIPPWNHPDEVRRHGQSVSLPVSRTGSPGAPLTPANIEGMGPPPIQTPYKPRVRRVPSPSVGGSWPGSPPGSPGYAVDDTPSKPSRAAAGAGPYTNSPLAIGPSQQYFGVGEGISRTPTPSLDLTGMQAQIDVAHEQAALASRETLTQIFPTMDKEILELVLEANNGDLGKSIESLLEMSVGD